MSITNYDGRLEEWYTNNALLKYAINNETAPSPVPLPEITNYDGMLEAIAGTAAENTASVVALIEAIKDGSINHKSIEAAYVLQLPDALYRFLGLVQIGGQTIVYNQLVDTGVTSVETISGHKYYSLIGGNESVFVSDGTAIDVEDDAADMVIDLTLAFGSGNEPAGVKDFHTVFPADHYAYDEGNLMSASVTDVISKDADGEVLQSLTIPAEVQALTGYGWSAGSAYNYIDFERKVFVQNVGSVDLGSLTYTWNANNTCFYSSFVSGIKVGSLNTVKNNVVCQSYVNDAVSVVLGSSTPLLGASASTRIYIKDLSAGTDPSAFKTAMSGVMLYYELATPVETDISAYLTENITDASNGGTLTFKNSHGDDYHIPVPVQAEYVGL